MVASSRQGRRYFCTSRAGTGECGSSESSSSSRSRRGPPPSHRCSTAKRFARNETFQVWALHVWVWRKNPNGTFADWNPKVNCSRDDA